MKKRYKLDINAVIRRLVIADFLFMFSYGLFMPIFAVFILETIKGSRLEVVGIAVALYWITRVLTTIPFSRFMDRTKGERDEYYFLVFGSVLWASIPLLFLIASTPSDIYMIQIVLGIAGSMQVPAWRILFTYHLDKGEVGYEWSLDDAGIGLATAVSAYAGAFIADHYGFHSVIISLSVIYLIGSVIIITLYPNVALYGKRTRQQRLKELKLQKKRHIRIRVKAL